MRGRGFTLLEVLVALALAATALMALADLSGNALRNHAYARELSDATLLAREKMAELEETYEDRGFKDGDEADEGSFEAQGHPEIRWKVEVLRPDANLSPEQVLGVLLGLGPDVSLQDVVAKLMGTTASTSTGSDQGPAGSAPSGPQVGASPLGAAVSGMLQGQLTTFGDAIRKSLRELRLTVSWRDDRQPRHFSVSTHLVVLHPKAPGGQRGTQPDVPPGLAPIAPGAVAPGALQPGTLQPGAAGVLPAIPGALGGLPVGGSQ